MPPPPNDSAQADAVTDHADRRGSGGGRSGDAVVRAHGVDHVFDGGRGVHDMELDIPQGCIFGLVGPSGSGKTTMVRLILGLLVPQDGSLEVFGVAPADFSKDERERIGFLPQESALDPGLSLQHNLQFMASAYGMPWRGRWMPGKRAARARERIDELLELLDLSDQRGTRLGDASTGEQRRLGIAAAMVHDPDLLVLDEPTAGIDPLLREQLWGHFDDLREKGRTLLVTTQYVTEADECDLVGLVIDGEILRVAPPDELRQEAFGGDLVEVVGQDRLPVGDLIDVEGVVGIQRRTARGGLLLLVEDAEATTQRLRTALGSQDDDTVTVSTHRPSFDDVFVRLVRAHRDGDLDSPARASLARHRKDATDA